MSFWEFVKITFVPVMVSFVLIIASIMLIKSEKVKTQPEKSVINVKTSVLWLIMFAVCLLAVLRILHFSVVLAVVLAVAFVCDKQMLKKADYTLLLTFMFFFIFVGNVQKIPEISGAFEKLTLGRECDVGIILSQLISNVPAAILLSGFTDNYTDLIKGVNLGGLGTLIASMASLISYKLYVAEEGARKGRFLLVFTVVNIIFLIILRIFINLY